MTSLRDLIGSARANLPPAPLACWASILFSLSILTFLISLSASQAFLAAASVFYALHLRRARASLKFPPVKLPLGLFCLTTVISVFWAANSTGGWLAVRKLVLFLIWLLAVNLVGSPKQLEILWLGLFFESALAGLVGVGQFVAQYRAVRGVHPDRLYYYLTIERIHGFLGHWMNFGGQQMLVFASLVAFLLLRPRVATAFSPAPGVAAKFGPPSIDSDKPKSDQKRRGPNGPGRRIGWAVLAIVALSIVLNFTRGVWLGCFVAVVYVVARWQRRWLWALPVLIVAGFFAAPSLVRERVEVLRHPASDPALAIRFEMWQVAWRMIEKHPWVGVGPNHIEEVYLLYLPPEKAPVVGYHEHFHNNFLQFGAERGLPCLAAWIWLMAALGWHFWRIRRQVIRWQWFVDGAISGWLAMLVEGCFEFNFGTSPVLMLFLFVSSTPFVVEGFERPASNQVES